MTGTLECYSFHSVKGGVGKSTLSTLLACRLARAYPKTSVVLIDMDLTGTSLSDVLPLEAPRWADGEVHLLAPPDGFYSHEETEIRISERTGGPKNGAELKVPFLNDFLLWADPDWSTEHDVRTDALCWRFDGAPPNLRVLPSSALPEDLERIIPVIFDEEHAAFLEARIEALLAALVPPDGERIIVFDTPPTIPGLSRSVLSLGLRLGSEPKRSLADDGYIPGLLGQAEVRWRIAIVLSQDVQDLRAAERWMTHVEPRYQDSFRLIVNRVGEGMHSQIAAEILGGQLGPTGAKAPRYPTFANFPPMLFVSDLSELQIFRRPGTRVDNLPDLGDLAPLAEWEK